MNARQRFRPGSLSHCGSVGSLPYCVVMMPTDLSRPAGVSTEPTERDTLFSRCSGFQPESCAVRIACAANFGVVILKNTFAPDALSCSTCESTVGSLV